MRGKFIIIDGTDGSGKATQSSLLVKRLRKEGKKVSIQDFPRYGHRSAALVEDYLNGKFGSSRQIGPYIPSIFFAVDRFAASKQIEKDLAAGKIVISNRYVTANLGHQGAKIPGAKARINFFQWANDLEYGLFKIPKPDLTIILHVSAKKAQELVGLKGERNYLRRFKKRDLHERDLGHLRAAEKTYLEMCRLFKFRLISCEKKDRLMEKDLIAGLIWKEVSRIL